MTVSVSLVPCKWYLLESCKDFISYFGMLQKSWIHKSRSFACSVTYSTLKDFIQYFLRVTRPKWLLVLFYSELNIHATFWTEITVQQQQWPIVSSVATNHQANICYK